MFQVPADITDAVAALDGIGSLLTAKEWERAAIVYAFTTTENVGGRGNRTNSRTVYGIRSFADLGIAGLKSTDSVTKYRRAWEAHGDTTIKPGDTVTLPTEDWPPTDSRTGNFDERIKTQVRNADPEVRREVFKELAESPDVTDDLATRSEATRQLEAATGRASAQRKRKEDAKSAPIRQSFELMRSLGAIEDIVEKAAFIGRVWREHANTWSEEEREAVRANWAEAVQEVEYTNKSVTTDEAWSMAELET